LQYAPDLVVHWVEIGAVGWPQIWWNEVWRLDFQEFDSFVSPMRWGFVLIKQLDSGEGAFKRVCLQVEDTMNTRCNIYHL